PYGKDKEQQDRQPERRRAGYEQAVTPDQPVRQAAARKNLPGAGRSPSGPAGGRAGMCRNRRAAHPAASRGTSQQEECPPPSTLPASPPAPGSWSRARSAPRSSEEGPAETHS